MSDTPRSDAHNWNEGHYDDPLHSLLDFARQLERELNAANAKIKRMEQAGDEMATWLSSSRNLGDDPFMSHQWNKAKEAKP